MIYLFLDATTHLYKSSYPSVGPSVPCYFPATIFEGKKLPNDIIINDAMNVVVVVACGINRVFVEHDLTSDRGYATHR